MTVSWQLENLDIAGEMESLRILVEDTDSNVLTFALYRTIAERESAVRVLKERLTLPVKDFSLSVRHDNPLDFLEQLGNDDRVCVFFYDVEDALPRLTGYLNFQREAFADVPHAVVFWVREYGLREIATKAPDFWAWRSGVFDFRSGGYERSVNVMRMALGEPLIFQDRGDLERRISLYQGLINEHGQQEQPDERFIARLEVRLANGFWILGRIQEAKHYAGCALERSRRIEDQALEAFALLMMGVLMAELGDIDESDKNFKRSLAILERVGAEEDIARSYHNLGVNAGQRGQFDEAEEWFGKSLDITESLNLEKDSADSFHNLGIIYSKRQKFDDAEKWYRKALKIYESLNLERDTAGEYHQLGNVAFGLGRIDEAEKLYKRALEITERLEFESDATYSYRDLGMIAKEKGRCREALAWLEKASAIATKYDMRIGQQVLFDLARIMHDIGEEEFSSLWKQAFPNEEPPLESMREIYSEMTSLEAEDSL